MALLDQQVGQSGDGPHVAGVGPGVLLWLATPSGGGWPGAGRRGR
jgi:hypothetical protein